MTADERHRHMDAARIRAELTVQDLWLRYLALGGTGDAFDLDGYLQGLMTLETFQQDILAQSLNEALADCYRAFQVPLSSGTAGGEDDDRLRRLIEQFLHEPPRAPRAGSEPPDPDRT